MKLVIFLQDVHRRRTTEKEIGTKIEEGENVAQYVARIKEVFSAIKGATSQIDDDTMLSNILRTLLPIYDIRVL